MSAQDCIGEIRRAAGRDLSDQELDDILTTLDRERTRRTAEGRLESLEDDLLNKADELAKEVVEVAQIERRNRLINIRVESELHSFAAEVEALGGDPALAVKAKQVGINAPVPGGRRSVGAEALTLQRSYIGGMLADLRRQDPNLIAVLNSKELGRPIARELAELSKANGRPGISDNADAAAIAKVIDKYRRLAVQRENRAGAFIRPLEGYVVRQSHDMHRIRRAGFDTWRDYILPRLDAEKTFQGADADRFLRGAFDGLVTGDHLKAVGAAENDLGFQFKGPGNLAKKISARRVLHFNDADAWFDYNEQFGTRDLITAVVGDFNRAAMNTALMRNFGTNPRAMRDKWVQALRNANRDNLEKFDGLKGQTLNWQFDLLDGTAAIPISPRLAHVAGGVTALQSMAKLGGAGISAFGDVFFRAFELRFQGKNLLGHMGTALVDSIKLFPAHEKRAIGELLGVGFETQMGDLLARFSATDNIPGVFSKAMRHFFKLNLLGPMTDANKRGTAMIMSRDLAMKAGQAFDQLDPDTQRMLSLFNIDAAKWDVYRVHAVREAPDGREYIFPEAVREMDDSVLKGFLDKPKATARQISTARDELEQALSTYYVDRGEFASPTPGAEERAILTLGTRAGTPIGVAVRLMAQFKGFPIAATTKAFGRELFGKAPPGTSLSEALLRGKGDLRGLAGLIVASTVFGYGIMSAKQLTKGLTPRDPEDPQTWVAAALQGGGLGIYGDFMFGEYNRFGRSLLDTLAGPTFGEINTFAELYARALRGEKIASQGLRLLTNNTPFINLFYTRQAMDVLILNQITEMLNPGALRRRERRLKRQNNQEFFIPPSRTIPRGGGSRLFEGVR